MQVGITTTVHVPLHAVKGAGGEEQTATHNRKKQKENMDTWHTPCQPEKDNQMSDSQYVLSHLWNSANYYFFGGWGGCAVVVGVRGSPVRMSCTQKCPRTELLVE